MTYEWAIVISVSVICITVTINYAIDAYKEIKVWRERNNQ